MILEIHDSDFIKIAKRSIDKINGILRDASINSLSVKRSILYEEQIYTETILAG